MQSRAPHSPSHPILALKEGDADYLVTRDKHGFRKSAVKILTPAELLALFP